MYHYFCLPDDGIIARRDQGNPQFERYDTRLNRWVPDWDLSGIASDDIRSIYCETERDAWNQLNSQRL